MKKLLRHAAVSLRLNFRNAITLVYGYAFPLLFLLAFWAIYRHDRMPLVAHMGELLTVTALGGACFGLPTTMVSEREKGVWRRYRLTPTPTWVFIASTLAVRYVLLLSAALLQIAVALAMGMTLPLHPVGLIVTFTCVAFAFMGLGLVIAMLADNVPAVQALGQCIFLPMLMIGGVAVRLSALPDWAKHVSAFLPGRYSVQALQASVSGGGAAAAQFELAALLAIGAGGAIAANRMFRWEPGQAGRAGKRRWLLVALASWALVGLAAEWRGHTGARSGDEGALADQVGTPADYISPRRHAAAATASASASSPTTTAAAAAAALAPAVSANAKAPAPTDARPATSAPAVEPPPRAAPSDAPAQAPASTGALSVPDRWQDVTDDDLRGVDYQGLPFDGGVIAPFATAGQAPDASAQPQISEVRSKIAAWPPGNLTDPVQRARNLIYVAAAPDLLQMADVEPYLPRVVLARLQAVIPASDLPKVLYWIALHPEGGDDAAVGELHLLGLPDLNEDARQDVRARAMLYALKMLDRTSKRDPGR